MSAAEGRKADRPEGRARARCLFPAPDEQKDDVQDYVKTGKNRDERRQEEDQGGELQIENPLDPVCQQCK